MLAIRGTEFDDALPALMLALLPGTQLSEQTILDLFGASLAEIVGLGIAMRQATSLLNYVLRMTASAGALVPQYTLQTASVYAGAGPTPVPAGAPAFSVGTPGQAAPVTWYWLETSTGSGAGLLAPGEPITVVGHSLGGHLAALALRLFPGLFTQAVVFNAAGFDAPGSRALTERFVAMVAPLLPGTPAPDFTGFDARLQNFASESSTPDNDLAVVPSALTGIGRLPPLQLLRTETNSHGMDPLMDNLAVLALLERLAPDLDRARLFAWFDAASTRAQFSAERLVGSLATLLLPVTPDFALLAAGWLGYPAGEGVFAARSALQDTVLALDAALDGQPALRLVSLLDLSNAELVRRARESPAYRHALREYLPYALTGDDTLYARLAGGAALDASAMSLSALTDRVDLYRLEMNRRLGDWLDGIAVGGAPNHYTDLQQSLDFSVLDLQPDRESPLAASIVIGSDLADTGPAVAGSRGRDRIHGEDGDDVLGGLDADDYLDGGRGNDVLEGGSGSDTLEGGPGDDSLYGMAPTGADDAAVDVLIGGEGYDRLYAAGGDLVIDADGELHVRIGEDWLTVAGRTYQLALDDGVVRVLQATDDTRLTLAYNRATRELRVGGVTVLDFQPGELGILLVGEGAPDRDLPVIAGTAADDRLSGTAVAERLLGAAGNDELDGDGGDDLLFGAAGHDTLRGGAGHDRLAGDSGRDRLFGGADDDELRGGDDGDALAGGEGDDVLDGGAGDDVLGGGGGRDVLVGGTGDDLLSGELDFGGAGADWIIERHAPSLGGLLRDPRAVRLLGFAALDVSALNRPHDNAGDLLYGGDGADLLFGSAGIDFIDGGPGDDTALGGDGADVMRGGDGSDHLRGGGGADVIDGGDGDDFLVGYGTGDDGVEPDAGDRIDGGAGNDELQGGAGDDLLSGGAGDDRLYGEDGEDLIEGDDGNDMLAGDAGNDVLDGGVGDDRLYGDDGDDGLYGGDGADYLDGGAGADILVGGDGADQLQGGDGDDVLRGDAGSDRLHGGAGNDILDGGGGHDVLDGGQGHDVFRVGDDAGDIELLDSGGIDELQLSFVHGTAGLQLTQDGEDLRLSFAPDRSVRIRAWRSGTIDRLQLGDGIVLDGRHLTDLALAGRVQSVAARLTAGTALDLGTAGDDDIVLDASAPTGISVSAGGGNDRYLLPADAHGIVLRIDDSAGENLLQLRGVASLADLSLALDGEAYVIAVNDNRVTVAPEAIARYALGDGSVLSADDFRQVVLNTVPLAPRLAQPLDNRAVYAGQAFTFAVPPGSFIDLNPGTVLTYAATLANGNPLPGWLGFDASTARFTGQVPAGALGSHAIRVTAIDPDGGSAEDVFGLDVLPVLARAAGATFAWQWIDGVNGFWIVTPAAAGTTRPAPPLAALGDLNADGYDDFLVGDTVRFGRAQGFGSALAAAALDGYDGFQLTHYLGDGFPYANSGLLPVRGDFNGDGIDDVLLPSPLGDASDLRVLHGRGGRFATSVDRLSLPRATPSATRAFPTLVFEGRIVTSPDVRDAGDVNGDGRVDWLVTVSGDTAARTWRGVVYAAASALPVVLDQASGVNATRILASAYPGYPYAEPDGALAASGWGPLLPLGDVNGDGRADLGLGSAPYLFTDQTVYAAAVFGRADGYGGSLDVSSLNGANGLLTSFPAPGLAYAGAHLLRAAGDLNGDGHDDFFAVDDATGAAYAVYGRDAYSGALHTGTPGDDIIHVEPNAVVHAGPGNDTLYIPLTATGIIFGGSGQNTFLFVGGTSQLQGRRLFHVDAYGGLQEDTYMVTAFDVAIVHLHDAGGAPNRLKFGDGFGSFNFLLRQGSVTLDFGPQGPQIHLEDVDPDDVLGGPRTVDVIEFDDGLTLTYEQLIARGFDVTGSALDDSLHGSSVVDRITGLGGRDLITGGRGNDRLDGGPGDDIYVQAIGDGIDVIRDSSGSDRVRFGPGIDASTLRWRHEARDLVIRYGDGDELRLTDWHVSRTARIERFEFADGNAPYVGQLVNRAPQRRVAAQTLWVDAGSALQFQLPSAWVVDPDPLDRLAWRVAADSSAGTAAWPSWLHFDAARRTLSGSVPAGMTGEVILRVTALDPQVASATLALRLSIGSGVTRAGTPGDDVLQGTSWADRLSGGAGRDTLMAGAGADVLDGGAGNDTLRGGNGNDSLTGGAGDDQLSGDAGSDTYWFARGSGVDRIANNDTAGVDELRYADAALPADFWFSRQGSDLAIARSATGDRVDIVNWYGSQPDRLDRIVADDRYALLAADVDRLVEAMAQFGPLPGPGSDFAPMLASQLAPTLAAVWRPLA